MPYKIIGVFRDKDSMKAKCEALKLAGYDVCAALNLQELMRHLEQPGCEIVLIGHAIPPEEKLRIGCFVRQYHKHCALLEMYGDTPALPMAHSHVRHEDGVGALLAAVAELRRSIAA
ncbi:MAG: hypothetical protein ABI383_00215 [Acidobacteriaceae bacterium]